MDQLEDMATLDTRRFKKILGIQEWFKTERSEDDS